MDASAGMILETFQNQQNKFFMKKSFEKFINASLKKIKQHKEQIKKFSFSRYKEDFVITAQEEKEGGFFGNTFKTYPSLR